MQYFHKHKYVCISTCMMCSRNVHRGIVHELPLCSSFEAGCDLFSHIVSLHVLSSETVTQCGTSQSTSLDATSIIMYYKLH